MKKTSILDLISPDHPIISPYSGMSYHLDRPLGQGGFGEAFLGHYVGHGRIKVPVCLKMTPDQGSWHCEAYFGELLRGTSRVVQLHEAFPLPISVGAGGQMFFSLVFDYVPNGSLADYLESKGQWPEKRARSEIVALLKVLNQLPGGGALHRDLTPGNVLVDAGGHLLLADFGIARHALGNRPS